MVGAYVGSQFIDANVGMAGDFVLSVQKLVALFAIPLGALLLRRFRWSMRIMLFALSLVIAFSAAPLLTAAPAASLGSDVLAVLMNALAALILSAALLDVASPVRTFGYIWLVGAVCTAVVALLQSIGWIPLVNVPDEMLSRRYTDFGMVRATGLKADPNFAAMMMVGGLAFTGLVANAKMRRLLAVLIVAGVAVTLSRMGIVVAAVVLIGSLAAEPAALARSARRTMAIVAGLGIASFTIYALLPNSMQSYIGERFGDLQSAVIQLVTGSSVADGNGSGAERADLVLATLRVIADHPLSGVGPGNLEGMLYESIGVGKAAHNTYLELLAIGGLFAAVSLTLYFGYVISGLGRASELLQEDRNALASARMFVISVALMAGVLTIVYNSLLWLPLALVCAMARSRAVPDLPAGSAADSRSRSATKSGAR
ncbi:MAG: O-antigen ligase family protein [Micropruina sp.]